MPDEPKFINPPSSNDGYRGGQTERTNAARDSSNSSSGAKGGPYSQGDERMSKAAGRWRRRHRARRISVLAGVCAFALVVTLSLPAVFNNEEGLDYGLYCTDADEPAGDTWVDWVAFQVERGFRFFDLCFEGI